MPTRPACYRFGRFRLDPAARELWRDGEALKLPLKVFDCIVYLLENRQRAVGRDELISAVWGDVDLSDKALGQAVLLARRALEDTGEEQQYIKTVRGFGYHWVAPVVPVPVVPETSAPEMHAHRWLRPRLALAVSALALLVLAVVLLRPGNDQDLSDTTAWRGDEGEIALLLPVTVQAEAHHSWIRFGALELISERLRAAGQPMVPAETVIALTRGHDDEPDAPALERVKQATGARLTLAAKAARTASGWQVSIRSLGDGPSIISALAEAEDVLDAALLAADRLALSMGLTPPPAPEAAPGLTLLLGRIEAARLAQQMDLGRELIEHADPEWRQHPEIRFQGARLDYYSHQLDAARSTLESLLDDPASMRDPVFRARVLIELAGVLFRHADYNSVQAALSEALHLLQSEDHLGLLGVLRRMLGLVALTQGQLEIAQSHLAYARWAFESTGDAHGLARLDNNLGLMAVLRDDYSEALHHFEVAAARYRILNDLGEELGVSANVVKTQLELLDPSSALAMEPRLRELMQHTVNAEIVVTGSLALAAALAENGHDRAAHGLLNEVWANIQTDDGLPGKPRITVLIQRAEQLARQQSPDAVTLAASVVEQAAVQSDPLLDSHYSRAWLMLLRDRLRNGDLEAAAEFTAAINQWANNTPTTTARVTAALAQAELAAAHGRDDDAEAAYTQAMTVAEAARIPSRILLVADSYVSWMLEADDIRAAPERVLAVADRLARYADRHYGSALLQLRTYHAMGSLSAWRLALEQARALAAERPIPEALSAPPGPLAES